jgi:Carboxypeptidase regulatory-like domain
VFSKTKSSGLIGLVIFTLIGLAPRLSGQATDGNIVGTVTDATQAVIPNATVKATNAATGVAYTTMTNSRGEYRINNVPVGTYELEVMADGMTPQKLTSVLVELNRTSAVNVTLQVASVTVSVSVEEAPPLIDSSTSQLENTFKADMAVNLPSAGNYLNDTGVLNLSLLAPGVTQSGGVGYGEGPSVGGQRPTNNSFNIDGVDNNRHDVTGPTVLVPNDAVAQFSILENQFSPEFGGASGGIFNIVVNSGTNNLHGSVYEYFNNRNLNALDSKQALQGFTSTPRFDYNRVGGTIGGPIIKNKLFYFGDYEYSPLGQASTPGAPIVAPTAAGYATIASLPGISKTNLGVLQQYLAAAPAANAPPITVGGVSIPVGLVSVSGPSYVNKHNVIVAVDWNAREADKVRGRYIYNRYTGIDTNAQLPIFYTLIPDNRHLFSLSEFHTFSPTALNEFRVSYSRKNNNYPIGNFTFPGLDQFPNLTFDDLNLQVGPDSSTPQGYIQGQLQGTDNFTKTFAHHTIKAGYQFMDVIASNSFIQRARGDYEYSMLDFYLHDSSPDVLGERSVGVQGGIPAGYLFHSMYVNDDFLVRPNLTFNLGLRYEYMTVPVVTRYQKFSSPADVPGVITFREPAPQKTNFAPRVGFAWSPGNANNWAIRGGFSVNYDLTYNNLNINSKPAYFQQTEDVNLNVQIPGFLAGGGLPPSNNVVLTADPVAARAAVSAFMPNEQIRPYSINYTLSVQRSFGNNYTVEARYVGTKGVHLFVQDQINRVTVVSQTFSIPTYLSTPSAATLAGLPLTLGDMRSALNAFTGGFGSNSHGRYGFPSTITGVMPEGNSKYNGLALQLVKRYTRNFSYTAAFTWSHAMDDSTATVFSTVLTPRRGQDFRNLRNDWSSSALDRRLRFTLAPVYDFKPFANGRWFMKNVVGNWNITGSYTFQSPEYATVQSGIDSNLNNDSAGDRAVVNPTGSAFLASGVTPINRAGQAVASGNAAIVAYVANNPNARYIQAGLGAYSNSGRNTIPLRRTDNVDVQLMKRFPITEGTRFEIAGQAFNIFNHPQWTGDLLNDVFPNQFNNTRSFLLTGNPEFGRFDHFYTSNPRTMTIVARIVF